MGLKELYNSKVVGFGALGAVYLFEHVQLMSFMGNAISFDEVAEQEEWDSLARDLFEDSEYAALRLEDNAYTAMYLVSCVLILVSVLLYGLFFKKVHQENKAQDSALTPIIWVFEHVVFEVLFVPIVSALVQIQFCDINRKVSVNTEIDCFGFGHSVMVIIGWGMLGWALLMAGIVFPVLKSERKGIEERTGGEYYFPVMNKLLVVAVISLLAPIRKPLVGLFLTLTLLGYLAIYDCYKERVVAALRMAVLFGQTWMFFCAVVAGSDGETGSMMLYGWPVMLLLGGPLMLIRLRVLRSVYVAPISK